MYERFLALADTPIPPPPRALLRHRELVQLNQRITLRWHMGPLSRRETVAYVLHRLRVAAGGDPPPRIFTRPALRLVHRMSRGVPRVVNMVAHRAMVVAFAAERRVVNAACVRQAYREIGALPLAAASRASPRRTAWAAAAGGACVGVIALGVVALAWRPELRLGGASESPAPSTVATPPEETPASEVTVATPPSEVTVATPPPPAEEPAPPALAVDPAPPVTPADQVERR